MAVLADHGCDFLLVGGAAAVLYGATRQTRDVDVVIRRSDTNLGRVAAALNEVRARVRAEGLDDDTAIAIDPGWDRRRLEQVETMTLQTDAGALDVLSALPDRAGRAVDHDQLITRAREVIVAPGLIARAASLDDIVASKEWADRPKDRDALPELRRLLDEQR